MQVEGKVLTQKTKRIRHLSVPNGCGIRQEGQQHWCGLRSREHAVVKDDVMKELIR